MEIICFKENLIFTTILILYSAFLRSAKNEMSRQGKKAVTYTLYLVLITIYRIIIVTSV